MADDKKEDVVPAPNYDEKIEAIENSIGQLTEMMVKMNTDKEVAETEVEEKIEPLSDQNKGKMMRLTIRVKEKDMPDLIKEIQENDNYEMENIELAKK